MDRPRFFTPFPGGKRPYKSITVPAIDTGGAFRPDWRMQDPARDPKEPFSSESSNAGYEHGWSNCTMVAAALAYAYQVRDQSGPQGGDMRHNQDDLSGGTDLYDAQVAWSRYGGQTLDIRTGDGWGAVNTAHAEGRAIVIQGEGNSPGAESFDGGHAGCIGPETNSEGKWLWGDPLATGWQWVSASSIRDWAERLSPGIAFAVSKAGEDMARYVSAGGYDIGSSKRLNVAAGHSWYYLDGTKGGEFSQAATVVLVGLLDSHSNERIALINTGAPYSDGVTRPTLVLLQTTSAFHEAPVSSYDEGWEDARAAAMDAAQKAIDKAIPPRG